MLEPYTNFEGLTKAPIQEGFIECPRCQGYGYFNYIVDAYGLGRNFMGMCQNCNGWGRFQEKDVDTLEKLVQISCKHKFKGTKIRNCLYKEICDKCGYLRIVDSSD